MIRPDTLVVAPLAEEVAALAERLEEIEEADGGRGMAVRGRLGAAEVVVAWTGDGRANASAGLASLLENCRPRRLLVVGVAGGVSDDLEVGDVIASLRVVRPGGEAPAPSGGWLAAVDGSVRRGVVICADRIAVTPAEKAGLRASLGNGHAGVSATVDVESVAYGEVAVAAGLPFLVVRAVSDRWDETLPLDFNCFLDARGGVDRSRVVRHVALRPRLMPALIDLKRRVELCAERLAEAAVEALRS